MSNFNLKKISQRKKLFYQKNNLFDEIGINLIKDKIKFIKKPLNNVLLLDKIYLESNEKIKYSKYCDFRDINNIKIYDGIISNLNLQVPFSENVEQSMSLLHKLIRKDGLLCFNLLTRNSMMTLKKIFFEIDTFVFQGAYNRFGPFHEASDIIEKLNNYKFKDIVVSNELIEINYKSFEKIRDDFKESGLTNPYLQSQDFKKDFLIKTKSIFSNLLKKHELIPLELEIATFTAWK